MKRAFLAFWLLIISSLAQAQLIRGTIPREYVNRPATDLIYEGRILLPEEAHELYLSHQGHFDLSLLNPAEDTDLWKDSYPEKLDPAADNIPVNDLDVVQYDSDVMTESGWYRLNVSKDNVYGVPETYGMVISKKVHSMLLLKGLLRKIGYQVPAMKRLSKVKIRFANQAELRHFKTTLETDNMSGDEANWVVANFDDLTLILQDVVIMDGFPLIYNLAMGPITGDMIQGRRLLSALAVPLAMTNVNESVNMLGWNMGVVGDNLVSLQLENADRFSTSWEDARWITRRIEKLSRKDWEEIVATSETPKPVQMLLVEKMLSRRNNAMKLFEVDAKSIKVEADLNHGVELVDGKLTQENWPGYSARFAFGDPESPLSNSELTGWVKSKAIQMALDGALSYANSFLGTDNAAMNQAKFDAYLDKHKDLIDAYNQTPPAERNGLHLPVDGWVFPTISGGLILTRNITTGAYMGTDNLISLVDAVGVNVSAGVVGSLVGLGDLAAKMPVSVSGGAALSYTRTYAHLRPVTTISKALKYPFKNILVPLVKRRYGKKLDDLAKLDLDAMTAGERQAKVNEAFQDLAQDIEIGESIIVTDTVNVGLNVQAGVSYKSLLSIQMGVAPGQLVVSRFHIHRKSENAIQIYRDLGETTSVKLSLGLNSVLPVLKTSFKTNRGTARTKFYSVSLNPAQDNVIEVARALRAAMLHSSLKRLDKLQKPYVLTHKFGENESNLGIFFWRFNRLRSHVDMSITHPTGAERKFFRGYLGTNQGRNYQDYAMDAISNILSIAFDFDYNSSQSETNPGYSFLGKAQNRVITYEGEKDADGRISSPFIRISRIWNGWSIKRDKAIKLLSEIKGRYRFEFFEPSVLNNTQKLFLYNVSVNILVYQRGVLHMMNLKDKEIEDIFRRNQASKDLTVNPADKQVFNNGEKRFIRWRNKYDRFMKKGDLAKASKYIMQAVGIAEKKLNSDGLKLLFGGGQNFYLTSSINGFRVGDENGDKSLVGSSLGEIGSRELAGPLAAVVQQTEMLEGEFFIYWLMTRLI